MTKKWRDVGTLYQIYPRSFQDTDSDGIGDIPGIISRLDYIASVADAIWLAPIYASPQKDFGYDVSSYVDIQPEYGTLADFDRLVQYSHDRNIKVMMDLTPNHTSEEHEWFKESRSSRDNSKRDWYVWRDPKEDGSAPNNWVSLSGGKAWTFDEVTGQYYLHSWMSHQPDLNWANPDMRQAMLDAMRFWLDRGVDGFRIDAVWVLAKNEAYLDDPVRPGGDTENYSGYDHTMCRNGDRLNEYLKYMADVVAEYDDRLMILEYYSSHEFGDSNTQLYNLQSIAPDVCTTFFFDAMQWPFSAEAMGQGITNYLLNMPENSLPVFCFGNHDQTRMINRFGGEDQARLIATMQLTLPGLPCVYYGEEIGMRDGYIPEGKGQDGFGGGGMMSGRDPERTPMQWSGGFQAGFTDSNDPWLPVGESYVDRNVESEETEAVSFLKLYRTLIDMRRDNELFRNGQFVLLGFDNNILAYDIVDGESKYSVMLNFADYEQSVYVEGQAIVSSLTVKDGLVGKNGQTVLRPFEAILVAY